MYVRLLAPVAALSVAIPATAQELPSDASPSTPAAAGPAWDPAVGATLTSDYRFRGISQSNRRPALQGTVNVTHRSGFFGGVWASTISEYVAAGTEAEIDLYGGYKHTSADGTTVDIGLLYYLYPDSNGVTTNFFEPYANVTHAIGPVTAKVGGNFAWKQQGLSIGAGKEGGLYLYGDLGAAIPNTPVTITGHVGRSFEHNYITFGTKYTDWSLVTALTRGPATLSAVYYDTNKRLLSYPAGGRSNRDIAKGGFVASLAVAF